MSKHKDELTASLFDEPVEQLEAEAVTEDFGNTDEDLDDWAEVPHARFLSWSNAMQLHYCWRRDLDAATRAENNNDAKFFLERAVSYKQELNNG